MGISKIENHELTFDKEQNSSKMINSVFLLSGENGRDDEEHGGGAKDRACNHEVHLVVRPVVHLHVQLLTD